MALTDEHNEMNGNDEKIFRSLFNEYYAPLCLYALRFTKDKSAAREVVQETFVKLWEHHEKIEINKSLSGYLYTSVRNNALNYLKRQQIKNHHNEIYAELVLRAQEYMTITRENGLSVLLAKELETQFMEAVDALPEHCREIFKLSRFEGLKNAEIADIKHITINTVQKQLSISLEKLRGSLSNILPKIIRIVLIIYFFGK